jgi:hypothetical protein
MGNTSGQFAKPRAIRNPSKLPAQLKDSRVLRALSVKRNWQVTRLESRIGNSRDGSSTVAELAVRGEYCEAACKNEGIAESHDREARKGERRLLPLL